MEIFRLIFSPIEVNTYILADKSGECAVIDCGCYTSEEFERLSDFMEMKKTKPVLLLNTHCHLDHVFGNASFREKYDLNAWCHELEEENRVNSVRQALLFGLRMDNPPAPGRFLGDGETVAFGSVNLEVLHVPGHTPGSIAFYDKCDNAVFTGDALFSGSIGRTDLPGGDFETLIQSIKNKLFVLPPSTIVYPGHGSSTTIEKELRTNPFFSDQNG
ncbi:MAG: MBL fold metallo-hydrolase [Bacteroidales bacterium]|jgi:glyoxylase-like metal-dependent hydrolase (beta-lactamase superfamily II)